MAKARNDFSDLLVRDKVLSTDQLEEARSMQEHSGAKLQDVLVKMGYCGIDQAMRAFAEFNKLDYVDLTDRTVPASVVELVPESIARENIIFAIEMDCEQCTTQVAAYLDTHLQRCADFDGVESAEQ